MSDLDDDGAAGSERAAAPIPAVVAVPEAEPGPVTQSSSAPGPRSTVGAAGRGVEATEPIGAVDHVVAVRASYLAIRGPLWRALVAWSGSVDVADEAVAEAFAQLLRRVTGPAEPVRDPDAWVWRAAFHLAAGDLKRRRADGTNAGDLAALSRLPATTDRLPDDALDLVAALARLSDQQRRCVALVDVGGHTSPSAAAVLGTSPATVRVQLARARRRLRVLLSEADDPDHIGRGTPEVSGAGRRIDPEEPGRTGPDDSEERP